MYYGDWQTEDKSKIVLGMEARSILKSIQTEASKMAHSGIPTRTDLHYFRARYNYYKLTILRLADSEKQIINPVLADFLDHLVIAEGKLSEKSMEAPPFLATVAPQVKQAKKELEMVEEERKEEVLHHADQSRWLAEIALLRLALQAPASRENNDIVVRALDRLADEIRSV